MYLYHNTVLVLSLFFILTLYLLILIIFSFLYCYFHTLIPIPSYFNNFILIFSFPYSHSPCSVAVLYDDITTNLTVPAPWVSGRLIETIHLFRNNYKFKWTVSFPGACHLYLKFDPRCSSQYNYDKVSLSHTYFLSRTQFWFCFLPYFA